MLAKPPFLQQSRTHVRSKQCVFLGYSAQHKGVKCLDVSTGRVYISRDVVFDETKFPFADLHPNAGALLRKEILLLPSHLTSFEQGGQNIDDQLLTNSSNELHESCVDDTGEIHEEIVVEKNSDGPYFMCPTRGDRSSSGSVQEQWIRSALGSPPTDAAGAGERAVNAGLTRWLALVSLDAEEADRGGETRGGFK